MCTVIHSERKIERYKDVLNVFPFLFDIDKAYVEQIGLKVYFYTQMTAICINSYCARM